MSFFRKAMSTSLLHIHPFLKKGPIKSWLVIRFKKQNSGVMSRLFRMRTKTQSVQDEVFQVSELVEPYRVAPSIDLEEN